MSAVVPQKSESALRADLLRNLALLQEDLHALATSVRQHASDWWAWKAPSSAEPGAFDPLPAWERSAAKGHILKAIETIEFRARSCRSRFAQECIRAQARASINQRIGR